MKSPWAQGCDERPLRLLRFPHTLRSVGMVSKAALTPIFSASYRFGLKRQPFETKPHFPEMWEKWGTKSFANDNASHYGFAAGFSSALAAGFGVWTFQNSGSAFTHSSRG